MKKKSKKSIHEDMALNPEVQLEFSLDEAEANLNYIKESIKDFNIIMREAIVELQGQLKDAKYSLRFLKKRREKECS